MDKLQSIEASDGTLLDHTTLLMGGSQISSHSGGSFPLLLAGGNKLGFRNGKLHDFRGDKWKPLANLFVSMLNAVDVPVEKFADSTGNMSQLMRS